MSILSHWPMTEDLTLAAIADFMPQIIWISNHSGVLTYCNQRWAEYTGQDVKTTLAGGWIDVVHPDDIQPTADAWNRALMTRISYETESRFKRALDGTYRWHLIRGFPIKDHQDEIMGWVGTSTDIDDLKNNQKQLQEISEHFQLALKSANARSWIWDIVADTITWDEHTYELFGLDNHYKITNYQSFKQLIHPLDSLKIEEQIKKVVEEGQSNFEWDYRVVWPDGSIHFLTSKGKFYKNESGTTMKMIGVCFDITERKHMEMLAHENQLSFAHKTKTSSVSEIASSLAHELNQPLTAITTFTQGCIKNLVDGEFCSEEMLYALKETAIQAERAGKIIHRMKNSVQKKYLYLEPTNFNDIIIESIKFINYENADNFIQINFHPCQDVLYIVIDKVQIQQVMINLLRNSLEALREYNKPNPQVFISCVLNDNMLTTKVIDNGPGFPKGMENRIEHMVSTKADGMGIGLSICRSIIEAHGGQLTLNNILDHGAQVQFTIPMKAKEA